MFKNPNSMTIVSRGKEMKISYVIIPLFVIMFVGGIFFYQAVEGLKPLDSVYFMVITLATIGYGDIHPETDAGKIFTICFAIIGVMFTVYLFTAVTRYLFRLEFQRRREEIIRKYKR